VLAGASEEEIAAIRLYGTALGAAFQITDDMLDETGSEAELGKPVGSDAAMAKNTYPSLLGLEASAHEARRRIDEALFAIRNFKGPEAELLRGLAAHIINRVR
ncbi:polyprenyl synthetase family protein, partial [Desulfovibrio sp. OttesenSCG-928-F20]|nr:polyprenyl synthetase family protein [Desulfovibrio sp. OttesenSCG-928-F20]